MTNAVQTASQERTAAAGAGGNAPQAFVVPPVDVFENENAITLLADLPGVSRDHLGVRVDGDSLFIEATATPSGPENMELIWGEAQIPSYRRQFTLSRELDSSRIEATLKDGVLTVHIPKRAEFTPRKIEVRVD